MSVLVTGGAGFIGSAVCRHLIRLTSTFVVNVDKHKLTYAANPESLKAVANNPRYAFERADICDRSAIDAIFTKYQPKCRSTSCGREPR